MTATKIVSTSGTEYSIPKRAVASINPANCVNCGKCRENCPVEAISEQQRVICRLCPSCTEQPALTHDQMVSLATEKACTTACPLGISPQGYVNLTRAGKDREAFDIIWEKNPLPSICARICHHPCEQACKRGILVDEPIAIRGIKRYLTDEIDYVPYHYPEMFEEKIAVIGAGPAGLTAAHYLASAGYSVTVFDSESEPGGMLVRAIPEFRLPRNVAARDIKRLTDAGIKLELGHRVGKSEYEELKANYDAVIVATGAPISKALKIEGDRKEGVMTALSFIERVNNGQNIWRHPGQEFKLEGEVVVIGGGDVAYDCARTAVRVGAEKVTVICLESGENIPGHIWERKEMEAEGISLCEGLSPLRFVGTHNVLEGVEVAKVTSFEKDADGRIHFTLDKDNTEIIHADWVVEAIGQAPDALWSGCLEEGNVYLAGDVAGGACSVVDAMASGKKTARRVIKALSNVDQKDPMETHILNEADIMEKIYPAARLKIRRPEMPIADAGERIHNFDEVEQDYSKDVIDVEVLRCLQCGYEMVDPDKCIGCGVCRTVCPKGDVIRLVSIEG